MVGFSHGPHPETSSHLGLLTVGALFMRSVKVSIIRGWEVLHPISILLIIPILWLDGLWVRNRERLTLKPILGFGGSLIDNLERRILIPILRLGGLWVGDSGLINPGVWLGILRVINLLGGVESWLEVLEKIGLLDLLTIQLNDGSVVGVDDQGVELGGLDNTGRWGGCQMLLLIFASLWVLVVDDQVDLVGGAALVWSKHNNVWGDVGELILVESLVVAEELQVSATTLETICKDVSKCLGREFERQQLEVCLL